MTSIYILGWSIRVVQVDESIGVFENNQPIFGIATGPNHLIATPGRTPQITQTPPLTLPVMLKKLLPNQYLLGQHLNGLRASRPLRHTFIKLKNLLIQRKQEIGVRAHLAQSVPVVELVRRIMDTFYLFYAIDVF